MEKNNFDFIMKCIRYAYNDGLDKCPDNHETCKANDSFTKEENDLLCMKCWEKVLKGTE